jgi:hypothetical protein
MAIVCKVKDPEKIRLKFILVGIFTGCNIGQYGVKLGPNICTGIKVARRGILEV